MKTEFTNAIAVMISVTALALNAADEMAVASFLEGEIGFDQIPRVIEDVLAETNSAALGSIHSVLEADALARTTARERIASVKKAKQPRATSFV